MCLVSALNFALRVHGRIADVTESVQECDLRLSIMPEAFQRPS